MGRRLSRGGTWTALIGLVALGGALARMGTLVEPTPTGLAWQWVLLGAFALGAVIATIGRLARLNAFAIAAVGIVVVTALLGRAIAPATMWAGIVPRPETLDAIAAYLGVGLEYLRYSPAPMFPWPEFVALLVPVLVAIGGGWAWLAMAGNGAAAAVAPAGLYLGVAVADQDPSGLGWLLAAVVWVGAVLVVSGLEETAALPRVLGTPGRRGALVSGSLVVVLAMGITWTGGDSLPGGGLAQWTSDGFGLGDGTSLNPYASIVQTSLVSNSEEVVFVAQVSPASLADEVSWRLMTLDTYDGTRWAPSTRDLADFEDAEAFAAPDEAFRLTTTRVSASVAIDTLRQRQLPLPVGVEDVATTAFLIQKGSHVAPDGSLYLDRPTSRGLTYTLQAEVPSASLGEIALAGGLSPLFEAAQEQGHLVVTGVESDDLTRPVGLERHTRLPDDLDPRIRFLARNVTDGASSDLERMVMLEEYFRDDGRFTYTTDIDDGHAAADLAAWLTEPDSANYQAGYCEQFATAMGVMGRALGVPTRLVLGFTPGRPLDPSQPDLVAVQGRNAHSWVEAWIDGVGWVKFDPTPRGEGDNPATGSVLPLDPSEYVPGSVLGGVLDAAPIIFNPDTGEIEAARAGLEEDVPTPGALEGGGVDATEAEAPFVLPGWVWWAAAALLALVAIPLAKWLRRRRRLALARDGDVSAAWDEITDRLRDLDRAVGRGMTPAEIAEATLPELAPLAAAHARATWGTRRPTEGEARRAMRAFDAAEDTLARTTPVVRKVAAAWRPRSLRRP